MKKAEKFTRGKQWLSYSVILIVLMKVVAKYMLLKDL
jgi:hypothetical protein